MDRVEPPPNQGRRMSYLPSSDDDSEELFSSDAEGGDGDDNTTTSNNNTQVVNLTNNGTMRGYRNAAMTQNPNQIHSQIQGMVSNEKEEEVAYLMNLQPNTTTANYFDNNGNESSDCDKDSTSSVVVNKDNDTGKLDLDLYGDDGDDDDGFGGTSNPMFNQFQNNTNDDNSNNPAMDDIDSGGGGGESVINTHESSVYDPEAGLEEIEGLKDCWVFQEAKEPKPESRADILNELSELEHMGNAFDADMNVLVEPGNRYYFVCTDWDLAFRRFLGLVGDDDSDDSIDSESAVNNSEKITQGDQEEEEEEVVKYGPWPGPVDNEFIFEDDGRVGLNMKLHSHFVLITAEKWKLLMKIFGGGPQLFRMPYNDNGRMRMDVEGKVFRVLRSGDPQNYIRINMSQWSMVGQLKRLMCDRFGLVPSRVRVWDYFGGKPYALLHQESSPLEKFNFLDNQLVMLEEANEDGEFEWSVEDRERGLSGMNDSLGGGLAGLGARRGVGAPVRAYKDTVVRTYTDYSRDDRAAGGGKKAVGLVGLSNLGNTCFMNSILQCLSNTTALREYFVSKEYVADRNETNPLGMRGKLADAFFNLLSTMWTTPDAAEVSPRAFKTAIAQFKPDFAGFQQHDSQEFLSFVLDGLHEDLNRVKQKPYVENVEGKGRPDEKVAQETWEAHKLRNDSRINDLFTGMFKSTVVCPMESCGFVSVTFDPFMCAQLPLQTGPQLDHAVTVYMQDPMDWSRTRKLRLSVPVDAGIVHLRYAVALKLRPAAVTMGQVVLVEVWNFKVHKILEDLDSVADVIPSMRVVGFIDEFAGRYQDLLYGMKEVSWKRTALSRPQAPTPINATTMLKDTKNYPDGELDTGRFRSLCPMEQGDLWLGEYTYRLFKRSMRLEFTDVDAPIVEDHEEDKEEEEEEDTNNEPKNKTKKVLKVSFRFSGRFDFVQEKHHAPGLQGSFKMHGLFVCTVPVSTEDTSVSSHVMLPLDAENAGRCMWVPGSWKSQSDGGEDDGAGGIGGTGYIDSTRDCLFGEINHELCGPFSVHRCTDPIVLATMRKTSFGNVIPPPPPPPLVPPPTTAPPSKLGNESKSEPGVRELRRIEVEEVEERDMKDDEEETSDDDDDADDEDTSSSEKKASRWPRRRSKIKNKNKNKKNKNKNKEGDKKKKEKGNKTKEEKGESETENKTLAVTAAGPMTDPSPARTMVHIVHQRGLPRSNSFSSASFMGQPTMFSLPSDATQAQLYDRVLGKLYELIQVERRVSGNDMITVVGREEEELEDPSDPLELGKYFDLVVATAHFSVESVRRYSSHAPERVGTLITAGNPDFAFGETEEERFGLAYLVLMWDWLAIREAPGTLAGARHARKVAIELAEKEAREEEILRLREEEEEEPTGENEENLKLEDAKETAVVEVSQQSAGENGNEQPSTTIITQSISPAPPAANLAFPTSAINNNQATATTPTPASPTNATTKTKKKKRPSLALALFARKPLRRRTPTTALGGTVIIGSGREPINELKGQEKEEQEEEEEDEDEDLYEEDIDEKDPNGLNLDKCLDMFTRQEQLSENDTWYCPRCKEQRQAFKKIEFWSLPDVLILQLKRFSQDAHSSYADKLDMDVDFPLQGLDLSTRCLTTDTDQQEGNREGDKSSNCVYDLYAVSNHFGGLGSGHYTAFARNANDAGRWYEFDDSRVRLVGDDDEAAKQYVQNSAAYVLFYVKRGSPYATQLGHAVTDNAGTADTSVAAGASAKEA